MKEGSVYSREEAEAIRAMARTGGAPGCPRCREPLLLREVSPRSDVAYVRSRRWWICPECRRSVVLDEPLTRGD